jgi:hypothetical protein
MPKQKPHSATNRHLNNERQEWKTGRALTGEKGKEGSKEGKYGWCTFYTRMNVEFLNLLNSP